MTPERLADIQGQLRKFRHQLQHQTPALLQMADELAAEIDALCEELGVLRAKFDAALAYLPKLDSPEDLQSPELPSATYHFRQHGRKEDGDG